MKKNYIVPPLIPEFCCSNLKQSLDFYLNILGFVIRYQREEEGFAMIERQGSQIMLDELNSEAKRSWISAPLEFPFGRGVNFEIRTNEIDALYYRVQKSLAPLFLPIEEKWYRVDDIERLNRQFIVLDPDGYMLRFSQNMSQRNV